MPLARRQGAEPVTLLSCLPSNEAGTCRIATPHAGLVALICGSSVRGLANGGVGDWFLRHGCGAVVVSAGPSPGPRHDNPQDGDAASAWFGERAARVGHLGGHARSTGRAACGWWRGHAKLAGCDALCCAHHLIAHPDRLGKRNVPLPTTDPARQFGTRHRSTAPLLRWFAPQRPADKRPADNCLALPPLHCPRATRDGRRAMRGVPHGPLSFSACRGPFWTLPC